jgi:hypothetical protein
MIVADLLPIVLWLAIEDYSGLWEVLWELNTRFPKESITNRDRARETVRELLRRRLVDLYWSEEPYGDPIRIPFQEAEAVLDDERNWEEPVPKDRSVRIGATETGEEVYEDLAREGLSSRGRDKPPQGAL